MFDKAVSPIFGGKKIHNIDMPEHLKFCSSVPVKRANTIKGLLKKSYFWNSSTSSSGYYRRRKIAPLVAAVGTRWCKFQPEGLLSLLKRAFIGSSKAEIAGSAAKTFAEKTGLTTKDLATVNAKPLSPIWKHFKQQQKEQGMLVQRKWRKTLAATGNNAALYDALDKQRTAAREGIINTGSDVTAVNKEGLAIRL